MYCVQLSAATEASRVGHKAAGLQKAGALGFAVPRGLVLSTEALTLFLAENCLTSRVADLVRGSQSARRASDSTFEQLRADVMRAAIPRVLRDEGSPLIADLLSTAPVGLAVRSSGVCEDMATASFAGVYESFLAIGTVDDVWDHIRQCWCSAWSAHAVAYARRMGVCLSPDHLAVIVQETIPADVSGVAFAADAVTGNPWRVSINATFGLSESLLRGRSAGDRFVLEWNTGKVLACDVVQKPSTVVATPSGTMEMKTPGDQVAKACLTDAQARDVADMALQLDRALGARVDVEWALVEDRLVVLQVRPIAALPAFFPYHLSEADAQETWSLQDRVWFRTVKEGETMVAPFYRGIWASELWLRHQPTGDGTKVFARPVSRELDACGYRYRTKWIWGGPWLDHTRTECWLDRNEAGLRADWTSRIEDLRRYGKEAPEICRNARSAADLIPELVRLAAWAADMEAASYAAPQTLGGLCELMLQGCLNEVAPGFAIGKLLQGLPSYSLERTQATQALACDNDDQRVRSVFEREPLSRIIPYLKENYRDCSFLAAYERLCWEFGIELPKPDQAVRPSRTDGARMLFIIRNCLLGRSRDARQVLQRCAALRQAAEQELRSRMAARSRQHLERFNKILSWAQYWVPALDDRGWVSIAYGSLRALAERAGEMLVREGVTDEVSDIFLLAMDDLDFVANSTDCNERRARFLACREAYERNRRLTPPQTLGTAAIARPLSQTHAAKPDAVMPKGQLLQGTGLSPGLVKGKARRMTDLMDPTLLDSLSPGDILVATDSDRGCYADWFAILLVVSGLVTTWGGGLHHATQIARELGVVYVNLPKSFASAIPDQAEIAVDGHSGVVTIMGWPQAVLPATEHELVTAATGIETIPRFLVLDRQGILRNADARNDLEKTLDDLMARESEQK